METLLEVTDLTIGYGSYSRNAVDGVSFTVQCNETVAIVGESGSGKSTTGLATMGLLADAAQVRGGSIRLKGQELIGQSERDWARMRGRHIGLVPQDPMTNLNPVRRIGVQVAEPLIIHRKLPRNQVKARVLELLSSAGLTEPERVAKSYPHQLSGGMKQRVLIAMAIACVPELLLADEPTSALDVTVQRKILDRLMKTSRETGASLLLITHDLAMAAERADRIIVMKNGQIVETGTSEQVFDHPQEDYTKQLISAAPSMDSKTIIDLAPLRSDEQPLLRIKGLRKEFSAPGFRSGKTIAADDVTFDLYPGRTLGIVGESGSGKSTVSRIVLGLETASSGEVSFLGSDASKLRGASLRDYRRQVQPVFQDPYSSLDSTYTIESIIAEPLMLAGMPKAQRRTRVAELLEQVSLPPEFAGRKPEALSGGQRQRVAIARALAANPRVVVCDEAVSALDVVVQKQILELLVRLQKELGIAYLFISHDLAVIRLIAHEVAVMQKGSLVEHGTVASVFSQPQADYTRELLQAIPGPHHANTSASVGQAVEAQAG